MPVVKRTSASSSNGSAVEEGTLRGGIRLGFRTFTLEIKYFLFGSRMAQLQKISYLDPKMSEEFFKAFGSIWFQATKKQGFALHTILTPSLVWR